MSANNIRTLKEFVREKTSETNRPLNPEWVLWSYELLNYEYEINPEWLRASHYFHGDSEPAMFLT